MLAPISGRRHLETCGYVASRVAEGGSNETGSTSPVKDSWVERELSRASVSVQGWQFEGRGKSAEGADEDGWFILPRTRVALPTV